MSQIKKLRKVQDHVHVFTPEDHNDHVDNWNAQLQFDEQFRGIDPDLDALIDQLKAIVSMMRKLKYGDFYMALDHNLFVDAWNIQTQINEKLKGVGVGAPMGELYVCLLYTSPSPRD